MRAHGLLFHMHYLFFVCTTCGTGVQNILRHCSGKDHLSLSQHGFEHIMQEFPVHPDPYKLLPTWSSSTPIRRIPHLHVHDGFACSRCGHCAKEARVLAKHFRNQHPFEHESETVLAISVTLQQLFAGKAFKFFPVIDCTPSSMDTPWDLFKSKAASRLVNIVPQQAPVNHELSQMLRHTLWPEHIRGHDPDALSHLAAHPGKKTEPELVFLGKQVRDYFNEVPQYQARVPRLLLQHLNSDSEAG